MIELTPADTRRLLNALADRWQGDVGAFLHMAEAGPQGQAREVIPPPVVNALYQSGIINQSEARAALGLKPSARARAARKAGKVANA